MIQIESISPESYAKTHGLCIGVGGYKCRCCNPDGLRAGYRKQKSYRARAKKKWNRGSGKKFWFED